MENQTDEGKRAYWREQGRAHSRASRLAQGLPAHVMMDLDRGTIIAHRDNPDEEWTYYETPR